MERRGKGDDRRANDIEADTDVAGFDNSGLGFFGKDEFADHRVYREGEWGQNSKLQKISNGARCGIDADPGVSQRRTDGEVTTHQWAVYRIFDPDSGRVYVGASVHVTDRWRTHNYDLRRGRHHNKRLQAMFDDVTESSLVWEVIEIHDSQRAMLDAEDVLIRQTPPHLRMNSDPDRHRGPYSPMKASSIRKRQWERPQDKS